MVGVLTGVDKYAAYSFRWPSLSRRASRADAVELRTAGGCAPEWTVLLLTLADSLVCTERWAEQNYLPRRCRL